jgi:hypothetical protein
MAQAQKLKTALEKMVAQAEGILRKRLLEHGIDDDFLIKIKPASRIRSNWVALYRGGTQLRGGRPIFWVPDTFIATNRHLRLSSRHWPT